MIELIDVSKRFKIPHDKKPGLKHTLIDFIKRDIEYETLFALRNINFSLEKGDFLGIIGKNGSGKSTLLRLISGIMEPTTGSVKVNGSISSLLDISSGFCMELSAKENIFLYGTALGMRHQFLEDRFDDIIRFAELDKFIDTKLKNFSTGMIMRLGFSIAIQADSDIVLADEVFSVGDIFFQRKCDDVFLNFKKTGKTVILVSHSQDSIKKICNKCLYLNEGEQISFGKTKEVIKRYLRDNN